MYEICRKEVLSPQVKLFEISAPLIARKARPGQFTMLRVHPEGERIPLTIAGTDPVRGTVTIIFQEVGATTLRLGELEQGDRLHDFVGPLGTPTELEGYQRAAVIGGGLGTAIAYPQARRLHELGTRVETILGFRSKDLIILEEQLRAVSDELLITTDDGSNGVRGFVSEILTRRIEQGADYDLVIAIGPLIMMKVIAELTRPLGIHTIVSMNPLMVDGTGMCGGCRVQVDGQNKFACVDGPDFDAHLVDFDLAMRRQTMYRDQEQLATRLYRDEQAGAGVAHA